MVVEGDVGERVYLVADGEADILKDGESVAVTRAGGYFGEIALLLSMPRTATVIARGYCDLYVLAKDTFNNILQRYPGFAKDVEELADARRKELGLGN